MTDTDAGPRALPGAVDTADSRDPLLCYREGDPEAFAVLVAAIESRSTCTSSAAASA